MAIIGAFVLNCVPLGMIFLPVPVQNQANVIELMLPDSNTSPLIRSQSSEHVVRANGKTSESDVARLTLSQPALNKSLENSTKSQTPSRRGSGGIMNRPDVLYQGSMKSLQNISTSVDASRVRRRDDHVEEKCQWLPCSSDFKAALAAMLDVTLLVDPIFILFSISNFLTSVGFYIPYVYIVAMSEKWGIPNPQYLISIIGASNLLGRIILGYISDKPWVNRLMAYNTCLTIAGISKYSFFIF